MCSLSLNRERTGKKNEFFSSCYTHFKMTTHSLYFLSAKNIKSFINVHLKTAKRMFITNNYGNCQILIMPQIRICLAAISFLLHRISPRYKFTMQLTFYLFFWTNKNVTVISIFLQIKHGSINHESWRAQHQQPSLLS